MGSPGNGSARQIIWSSKQRRVVEDPREHDRSDGEPHRREVPANAAAELDGSGGLLIIAGDLVLKRCRLGKLREGVAEARGKEAA